MTTQGEGRLAQAVAIHAFDNIGSVLSVSVATPVIIHAPCKDSL